jgi:hypothetical protein
MNVLFQDLTVPCMSSVGRWSLVVLDMALKDKGIRLQVIAGVQTKPLQVIAGVYFGVSFGV